MSLLGAEPVRPEHLDLLCVVRQSLRPSRLVFVAYTHPATRALRTLDRQAGRVCTSVLSAADQHLSSAMGSWQMVHLYSVLLARQLASKAATVTTIHQLAPCRKSADLKCPMASTARVSCEASGRLGDASRMLHAT